MAAPLPPAKQKVQLRIAALSRRDEMDPDTARSAATDVCERLASIEELGEHTAIAGYAPIRNEIDAGAYLRLRNESGAKIYFPRVEGDELDFVPVDDFDRLEEGAFGVPEPDGEAAPIDEIDLFLVPGVVYDHEGHRLGFGRGFYDRALTRAVDRRQTPPLLVGVCYQWQLLEGDIPVEDHDVSMDLVVTDEEVVRCADDSA